MTNNAILYLVLVIVICFIKCSTELKIGLIVMLFVNMLFANNTVEHMSANNEAINNIASLYNNKTMTVDNIIVKNNLKVNGIDTNSLNVSEHANTKSLNVSEHANTKSLNILNENDMSTHFNYANKNLNYIRGDLQVDGKIVVNGDTVIQGSHLSPNHIKMLRGERNFAIQSSQGGHLSDKGGWKPRPSSKVNREVMYMRDLGL